MYSWGRVQGGPREKKRSTTQTGSSGKSHDPQREGDVAVAF